MSKSYVYILTNKNKKVLYTGVTSNLINRIFQHKTKYYKGSFSARYNCDRLVFYREFENIIEAINFEKKIKAGNRERKEKLINSQNPEWIDLAEEWIFPV
ncbi:MAG: GIY-YIG nuclease family protein [Christiangramia sp.]|nr:GIY-YIG nuclease family protein [Christiangramia sp.]